MLAIKHDNSRPGPLSPLKSSHDANFEDLLDLRSIVETQTRANSLYPVKDSYIPTKELFGAGYCKGNLALGLRWLTAGLGGDQWTRDCGFGADFLASLLDCRVLGFGFSLRVGCSGLFVSYGLAWRVYDSQLEHEGLCASDCFACPRDRGLVCKEKGREVLGFRE